MNKKKGRESFLDGIAMLSVEDPQAGNNVDIMNLHARGGPAPSSPRRPSVLPHHHWSDEYSYVFELDSSLRNPHLCD